MLKTEKKVFSFLQQTSYLQIGILDILCSSKDKQNLNYSLTSENLCLPLYFVPPQVRKTCSGTPITQ